MLSDFATYQLMQPLGLVAGLTLLLGPMLALRKLFPAAFAAAGWARLMSANCAVAAAAFVLSTVVAYSVGSDYVELGVIKGEDLYVWVAQNCLRMFMLGYIFIVLPFTSFLLTPVCLWLLQAGRASVRVFAAIGVFIVLALGVLLTLSASGEWRQLRTWALIASNLAALGSAVLLVCLAFALGARLPLRKRARASAI